MTVTLLRRAALVRLSSGRILGFDISAEPSGRLRASLKRSPRTDVAADLIVSRAEQLVLVAANRVSPRDLLG